MKNKTVYVNAQFAPIGKDETTDVPTGEKTKGFFGGTKDVTAPETNFVKTGYSDSIIDGEKLQSDIQRAIESLNDEGYEVVSITSLTSGNYDFQYQAVDKKNASYAHAYGYGYSYTEGVVILAKKNIETLTKTDPT